jgi:hypothetical protein
LELCVTHRVPASLFDPLLSSMKASINLVDGQSDCWAASVTSVYQLKCHIVPEVRRMVAGEVRAALVLRCSLSLTGNNDVAMWGRAHQFNGLV